MNINIRPEREGDYRYKNAAEEFDRDFSPLVKKHMPSQDEFAILCRSVVL